MCSEKSTFSIFCRKYALRTNWLSHVKLLFEDIKICLLWAFCTTLVLRYNLQKINAPLFRVHSDFLFPHYFSPLDAFSALPCRAFFQNLAFRCKRCILRNMTLHAKA